MDSVRADLPIAERASAPIAHYACASAPTGSLRGWTKGLSLSVEGLGNLLRGVQCSMSPSLSSKQNLNKNSKKNSHSRGIGLGRSNTEKNWNRHSAALPPHA